MAAILDASDALTRMTQLMENAPPPRLSKDQPELKRPTREWLDSVCGATKTEKSVKWLNCGPRRENEALRKLLRKEEMTLCEGTDP